MTIDKILTSIDAELARLRQVRALLCGDGTQKTTTPTVPKKRKMSAAARKRIGEAQRKRWACRLYALPQSDVRAALPDAAIDSLVRDQVSPQTFPL
jgi:hypothetical protein